MHEELQSSNKDSAIYVVDRANNFGSFCDSARTLKRSRATQKFLMVYVEFIPMARKAMILEGVSGNVIGISRD
jgi:hypothetical protein